MRQVFSITRESVRGRGLDELVSSISRSADEEARASLRKHSIIKSRPQLDTLMETLLDNGAKLSAEFGLPPFPGHAVAPATSEHELPILPDWALQRVALSAAKVIPKTASEIVARVSVGRRVSSEITSEFRKKTEQRLLPKAESEITSLLPVEMLPLAEVLREALALFPEEELEQVTSDWDWKLRHLAQKLSK